MIPAWLAELGTRAADGWPEMFSRWAPPADARRSAVLVLLADGPSGLDVLLIERASGLRNHAGQPAFPGGGLDATDDGPADCALREAAEEVGLDRSTVEVVTVLPELWIPVSGYGVAPVLAWWERPHPVSPAAADEVARVARVPVADLVDPANRWQVRHPSGMTGPAFGVAGMLVWGFTANLLDRLLAFAGLDRPWNRDDIRDLPGVASPDPRVHRNRP